MGYDRNPSANYYMLLLPTNLGGKMYHTRKEKIYTLHEADWFVPLNKDYKDVINFIISVSSPLPEDEWVTTINYSYMGKSPKVPVNYCTIKLCSNKNILVFLWCDLNVWQIEGKWTDEASLRTFLEEHEPGVVYARFNPAGSFNK